MCSTICSNIFFFLTNNYLACTLYIIEWFFARISENRHFKKGRIRTGDENSGSGKKVQMRSNPELNTVVQSWIVVQQCIRAFWRVTGCFLFLFVISIAENSYVRYRLILFQRIQLRLATYGYFILRHILCSSGLTVGQALDGEPEAESALTTVARRAALFPVPPQSSR